MSGLLELCLAEVLLNLFVAGSGGSGNCFSELLHINCMVILIYILLYGLLAWNILDVTWLGLLELCLAEFALRLFVAGSGGSSNCFFELLHLNCMVILIYILLYGLLAWNNLGLTQRGLVNLIQ